MTIEGGVGGPLVSQTRQIAIDYLQALKDLLLLRRKDALILKAGQHKRDPKEAGFGVA